MKALSSAAFAAVLLVLGMSPAAARDDDLSPADIKRIRDYTLTMDKVHAWQAAQVDFRALEEKDPAFKAEVENATTDKENTIAQIEAKMDKHPRLVAIYRKHGLKDDDVILMPLALMGAMVAVQYPQAAHGLAARTSAGQIAFFRAHQKELTSKSWLAGGMSQ